MPLVNRLRRALLAHFGLPRPTRYSDAYLSSVDTSRFVFIGGLHRSGTSPLYRLMSENPTISAFRNTGVPEDEGQHLQSVYPAARAYGGPGKFAFFPEAHLTESSSLVSDENRLMLLREWGRYLDYDRTLYLEKSPKNLIQSRFLQALFPGSRFIFIVRHPIAVSLATQKWAKTPVDDLLEHWRVAHEIYLDDRRFIDRTVLVRYEDIAQDRLLILQNISALCDAPISESSIQFVDLNAKYFASWEAGGHIGRIARTPAFDKLLQISKKFGYSLTSPYLLGQ